MFYETAGNRHGLAHDPFKAIVAPRPIGWIGTKGRDGSLNLAPYSFFNAVCDNPKLVMFSSGGAKDSWLNAAETGVFTCSFVGRALFEKMNASSVAVAYGIDEFAIAGLVPVMGRLVDAPYVDEAPAVLECRVTEIVRPKTLDGAVADSRLVFGQVVAIHIGDAYIRGGRFDAALARPMGRMGYMDYTEASAVVELLRPPKP